jgi:hypothetical protein
MVSTCIIKEKTIADDIIQIKEMKYLVSVVEELHISKSYDGCTWTEIPHPCTIRPHYVYSPALFKTPQDQLGLVWSEKSLGRPQISSLYMSIYEAEIWSAPRLLFQREEICHVRDAVMLVDGALLILWDEPYYIPQPSLGPNTIGTGCDLIYRAWVINDDEIIERIFEPENLTFCIMKGLGFIVEDGTIWCAFYQENEDVQLYRSKSRDGKKWDPPELIESTIHGDQIILTPQGKIGIVDHDYYEKRVYLYTSVNWKTWRKEIIFESDDLIAGIIITQGESDTLWGIIDSGSDVFLIESIPVSQMKS